MVRIIASSLFFFTYSNLKTKTKRIQFFETQKQTKENGYTFEYSKEVNIIYLIYKIECVIILLQTNKQKKTILVKY